MKQMEEMTDALSQLVKMAADEKSRQELTAVLLPISVFFKNSMSPLVEHASADYKAGLISAEDAQVIVDLLQMADELYTFLIVRDGRSGEADLNTGYIMDIHNTICTLKQFWNSIIDENVHCFYPSTTNIEKLKTSMNSALIAANDSKDEDVMFVEV